MTTNDATRAALVERAKLVDLIAALITLRTQWSPTDRALEIINTVLAVHGVPETDAVDDDLGAMLDSVRCIQFTVMESTPESCFDADVICGRGPEQGGWDKYSGTGPTRKAAVLDAVAKAKEQTDDR